MTSDDPQHPGVLLKERFLDPLGITLQHLADAIDVPAHQISELVAGIGAMTTDIAMRLGLYFDVPARWWLEMQARFDAHDPERLLALQAVVTPLDVLVHVLVTPTGVKLLEVDPMVSGPQSATVSADFLARLRAQVKLADRHLIREPEVVFFEDGTPTLTGR